MDRHPSLPIHPAGEDAMSPHAAVVDVMASAIADFAVALLASGASFRDVVAHVRAGWGDDAVPSLHQPFTDHMALGRPGDEVLDTLDAVAEASPSCANAWLNEALASGKMAEWAISNGQYVGLILDGRAWITSLPDRLEVQGSLSIQGCSGLTQLPSNLKVGGCLEANRCRNLREVQGPITVGETFYLYACMSLECLPQGMAVEQGIALGSDAPAWDGHIPPDARAGWVSTPQCPQGVDLAFWRRRFPEGEPRP